MNTTTETQSASRLKNRTAASAVWTALSSLQVAANRTKLEYDLLELVKMRSSQINRCAFCLDLHVRTAVAQGESQDRLYLLPAWEEVSSYTPREKAAIRWTETLTQLSLDGVPDDVFNEVSEHFSEQELLELTLQVIAINSWNRLNVAFRIPPDANYWPAGRPPARREKVAASATEVTVDA